MERVFELAGLLTALPSVSGYEEAAFKGLEEICGDMFDEAFTNPAGSFVGIVRCGKPDAKALILDAHLDEIGFIVSQVHDDGFLSVVNAGGVDTRVLPASEVTIYGKKAIRGIFTSKPPHLQSPGEADKKLELKDIYIDTGMSGDELKKLVRIGDFAEIHSPLMRLKNNFAVSKSMDDKICIAQIIRAIELIDRDRLNIDIYCIFSGGEEIGGKGAATAAFAIDADWAVALDVCNCRMPEGRNYLENIKPGDGSVISYSSTTGRAVTTSLLSCAEDSGIKFQLRGEPGRTGTNAHYIQISRAGIPCTNLSVPLRYMHTGVEVISLEDVKTGAEIIARFAEKLGGDING
ncbi:MAG: M20/M25/M40 family metallo-hydrolase [Eubacteriales bacterium]|nr:M20/M25/M40 family metallo-hydrolase [Eubacteriales bacterium]